MKPLEQSGALAVFAIYTLSAHIAFTFCETVVSLGPFRVGARAQRLKPKFEGSHDDVDIPMEDAATYVSGVTELRSLQLARD